MSDEARVEEARGELSSEHVRAVRIGHGANCSSIGSVVDTLFVGAAVGGAVVAAILAAMKTEPVRLVGSNTEPDADDTAEQDA